MSKATILIRKGTYRNKPVDGKVFELVEQYKKTASGGFFRQWRVRACGPSPQPM